ncbi:hypothetical protein [Actinoallomurus iriomotensis]|nr:hypothetical protein [Actinoallomurus iriomotensis]
MPPIDLLAGGPDWLPWEWLVGLMNETPMLTFVHWWDGSSWSQAPTPDGMEDGVFYNDSTTENVYWDLADDYDKAVTALENLVSAARTRAVDRSVIEALAAPLGAEALSEEGCDVRAALDIADRTGVTPGSIRPDIPAGHGEPADRRVHVLDPSQVSGLITTAMRASADLDRPEPDAGPALERAVAWVRDRCPDGTVTVAYVGYDRPGFTFISPGGWLDKDLSEVLDAWRQEGADPRTGHWTHARIRATADTTTVERAYDHVPAWWQPAYMPDAQVAALRTEMARRDAQWRPGWVRLLDEDFEQDGAPTELCWRPGRTVESLG